MTRKISISMKTFFVLVILIVFGYPSIFNSINATPPLPNPPANEIESEKLLIEAKNQIIDSEYLISKAKKINLSEYTFFDKMFVKIIIRKMERNINSAKLYLNKAKDLNSIQEYG
jgi:menaquinone-dependent protoporphyrinogen IX oxidase